MFKSIPLKPKSKEKYENEFFRAGILKPKMNFTNADSVWKKLDEADWTVPSIFKSEALNVFFQVYPVITRQIKTKIEQEIDK